ncbi:MAG: NAD(+) diphosphatase [Gammaproteobacteria bacterium]
MSSVRPRIPLAGDPLDRLAHKRKDKDWLATAASSASFLLVQGSRNLVHDGDPPEPVFLSAEAAKKAAGEQAQPILLGELDSTIYFAMSVPREGFPPPDETEYQDLRVLGSQLTAKQASILAFARAITTWHQRHRYCANCGAETKMVDAGHARLCMAGSCEKQHFPRVEPAIIVLITRGDLCLLGRQASWRPRGYSTVAGFVEPGESLEDAVIREAYEETGVAVTRVRYFASQPWPFPAALMLGFFAETQSESISLRDEELEDAIWVSRDDIREGRVLISPPVSIAYALIREWFNREDGADLDREVTASPPFSRADVEQKDNT